MSTSLPGRFQNGATLGASARKSLAPEALGTDVAWRGLVPEAIDGCDARICSNCSEKQLGPIQQAGTPIDQQNGRTTENGQAPANGSSTASKVLSSPSTKEDQELVKTLSRSRIYSAYERAFTGMTGLPLALRPVNSWKLPHHGKANEAPFCALMARTSPSCQACLNMQAAVAAGAAQGPCTIVCHAGLTETAVPVRLGKRVIGFLQTGQIFARRPSERQFESVVKLLGQWRVVVDLAEVRKAYFATRVMDSKRHACMEQLLALFAQHLAIICNEILLQSSCPESPFVTKAKTFIRDHHVEDLRLPQLAKLVHMDHCYFCKRFKEGTGLTFTDYLGRVRIEHAKDLLANTTLRVSEIGFQVGFQSLTHFNRKFQQILGQSPTEYRMRLRKPTK